jgi:hypothetical protein
VPGVNNYGMVLEEKIGEQWVRAVTADDESSLAAARKVANASQQWAEGKEEEDAGA